MHNFTEFKMAIKAKFDVMNKSKMFITNTTKDEIWDVYISSFPEGSNPIYKERTEHDCNCCKQFLRAVGNMVTLNDNVKESVWDIDIGGDYQVVADALSAYVKSKEVRNIFLHDSRTAGTDRNFQEIEDGEPIEWNHFHIDVPEHLVDTNRATVRSSCESGKKVAKRGFDEITLDAIDTVIDLILQNSIYRGEEHLQTVEDFLKLKKEYDKLDSEDKKDNFAWNNHTFRLRNSVIGTLLTDISDGVDLNRAVASFESKVAPNNYKRTSALITPKMVENAEAKVEELGISGALQRRYATIDDLTINNIIFGNRSTKKALNVFDELKNDCKTEVKSFDKVEEVSIKDFINNVIPSATKLEVLVENKHLSNFVSLIAPVNDSSNMLKWGNNFTWSYNGDVTDSIKERVKRAGGNVTGDLRFSLSWFNYDDLDIHAKTPNGTHIHYGRKSDRTTGGCLDVDMNVSPTTNTPVENITWARKGNLTEGKYEVYVHNFTKRDSTDVGFEVEMEFMGDVQLFSYEKVVRNNANVTVMEFNYTHANGIEVIKSLPSSGVSKEQWGISTQQFHNVSMVMNSPNHWDGEKTGNKHFFFMLDDCNNDGVTRGFYNEFLNDELTQHRKVFEVLSSKMKVEPSENQLSGVGFSSTVRNHLVCKVTGTSSRIIKIKF